LATPGAFVRTRRSTIWRIGLATGAILLACGAADADVLEIGDNGAVRVRSGGGDVQWVGDATVATDEADTDAVPDLPADAVTEIVAPQVPAAFGALLRRVADDFRVSPDLLAALVWQESRWRPAALSGKGAVGLAQLMPATARAMSVDPRDPAANLAGGAHYLRQMLDLFDGDVERALAAYNAGPGRVQRAGGVPRIAETQAYVTTIIDRLSPVAIARNQGQSQGLLR
jgi:hypothetical protein